MNNIIYKINIDTFKYGFTAYYSSIEKAIKLLPLHPNWDQARMFMNIHHNWQDPINKLYYSLKNENELHNNIELIDDPKDRSINVYLRSVTYSVRKLIITPEVKELDKPYKPESYRYENQEDVVRDMFLSRLYYNSFEVNIGIRNDTT